MHHRSFRTVSTRTFLKGRSADTFLLRGVILNGPRHHFRAGHRVGLTLAIPVRCLIIPIPAADRTRSTHLGSRPIDPWGRSQTSFEDQGAEGW